MSNNDINDINEIHAHLSYAEGDNIKETINKMPPLSYITFIDNNSEYHSGGILIGVHKTYFKLLTNVDDIDSMIKVKYSKIKKIYYVYNIRSYKRIYQNNNKDKKKEHDRRYYLKKKALKEQ
jgi:hypothetical protein